MKRGLPTYVGRLVNHAAAGTVTLTDRLSVLIVPFTTLALWAAGAKMTDTIAETLALGVAITVASVVILRLLAASYFVWKDDGREIHRLREELALPGKRERDAD